ncbi:MAG: GMC family oxidoreductase [Bdellovibrionota bacterium]
MMTEFDLCVVGSGAGAGPVVLTAAEAGYRVVVLEKGPWFTEADFFKDEIACCRRSVFTPRLKDEQHVLESPNEDGTWKAEPTSESGWDFWNGNCVGGSSNFMTGFFHRLKPKDLRLRTEFGPIQGANVVDWPITYDELEPYYAKVETTVGVSGRVVQHPFLEPRSTPDFPYPPTAEHPYAKLLDNACKAMGLHPIPAPRAVLPYPALDRSGCSYSGYCGSYGCATGAKGSSRAALLNRAVKSGNCEIRPHSMVARVITDHSGRATAVEYFDGRGVKRQVTARMFVVACQAVETSRLLLLSTGPKHVRGLGNNSGQLGKNLVFSSGGIGSGDLMYAKLDPAEVDGMKAVGPFVNRALQDWYFVDDPSVGGRAKGGLVEFDFQHPNPINRATRLKRDGGKLVWGDALKKKLKAYFTEARHIRFEVFCDWLPTDGCNVSLDPKVKDKWGLPVARVKLGYHPHDVKIGTYVTERAAKVFEKLGAENVDWNVSTDPPSNLMAGGCRFGRDPKTSVLDPSCRIHDAENVFVTDGSFMPTGGSVPYTFTIYANSFRVADAVVHQLGGAKQSKA